MIKKRKIKKNISSAYDHKLISWTAPEHIRHERGILWKILAAIFVAGTATLGVMYEAWTFSLAVLAFALAYAVFNREEPKNVEIVISTIGIKAGNRKYPFGRIKDFWVIYHPPYTKTLNFHVEGELAVNIEIQLEDQDPSEIRKFMLEKIPERKGQTESVSDLFVKLFKI